MPGLPEVLVKVNEIFDRRTKQKLLAAAFGSLVISIFDTLAIALVFPLVNLATGSAADSGVLGQVSDLLGDPSERTLLVVLTFGVVGLFVLKDLGSMLFNWWMTGFIFSERVRTSARLLRHFLSSPYHEIAGRSSADLLRAMDYSVMQVFNNTVSGLMYTVTNSIAIAAVALALMVVSPLPTLAAVAYFGLAAMVFLIFVKPRATAAGEEMLDASLAGWRSAFAALGAMKELRVRGSQDHFVDRYQNAQLRGAYAGRTSAFLGGLPRYMLEILFIMAIGVVLMVSVLTSATESPSDVVSLLALFVAAGFRILPSVTGLLANASNIKVGRPSLDIVHREVLASRASRHLGQPKAEPLPFAERLRVENVCFTYPSGSRPVLDSVSFDIPHGSSVALVGSSGAGKTTLLDLLLGLNAPSSGRITVDGVDITTRLAQWQRNIGYVAQDVYVLDATMAENIAFDQPAEQIDKALLHRVIEKAQLVDLVAELPDGVDTEVGERGARLSGGQRQRIGIARALYREPQLLVLDEATSALDNETEHRISQTLAALHGQMTVVIVAHRLSTVRDVDQVVFLKDGQVETVGTFEQVRGTSPDFANLVALGSLDPTAGQQ